jgi:prephenate dehydrogenase
MNRVAIIGVGLIGGSLGLALKHSGFEGTIAGADHPAALKRARERGALDEAWEELEPAVAGADLVFLAAPILAILDLLGRVRRAAPDAAVVTDAGSTKTQICDRASTLFVEGPLFIGGHPLAGREQQGVEAANAGLFRGTRWVLTPQRVADLETPRGSVLLECIETLGAQPVVMDAEVHDQIVAWTSHLPQLTATALAATVLDNLDDPEDLRLSAAGLRDTTRLADSPYRMWRDICLTNSENLETALSALIQKLDDLRDNLRRRALEEEFRRARQLREHLRGTE